MFLGLRALYGMTEELMNWLPSPSNLYRPKVAPDLAFAIAPFHHSSNVAILCELRLGCRLWCFDLPTDLRTRLTSDDLNATVPMRITTGDRRLRVQDSGTPATATVPLRIATGARALPPPPLPLPLPATRGDAGGDFESMGDAKAGALPPSRPRAPPATRPPLPRGDARAGATPLSAGPGPGPVLAIAR